MSGLLQTLLPRQLEILFLAGSNAESKCCEPACIDCSFADFGSYDLIVIHLHHHCCGAIAPIDPMR